LKKIIVFLNRFIDLKMGLIGAVIMGGIVFMINYFPTQLLLLSFVAAMKQFVYTFFLGGAVMKSCEYIAVTVHPKKKAIFLATVVPFLATLLLVFGLHNLRGTPLPLQSTMPTLFVITGTFFWAVRKRKQMESGV